MFIYDVPSPAYNSPPAPPTVENGGYSPSTSSSSSSAGVKIGTGICFAVVAVVVAVIIRCIFLRRRQRRKVKLQASNGVSTQTPAPAPTHDYEAAHPTAPLTESTAFSSSKGGVVSPSPAHFGPQSFTYEQLSIATKHFSDSELLGRGGSGSVYRGRLPEDGPLVAVKCIPENSNKGVKEFNAEVSIISELRHRNLVKLKGWCHDQGKFVLVYDYMPNGSLDYLLFNPDVKLNWARWYAIVIGLGSALVYLHEECDTVIIHRDIKSSNVLLDESFNAKLGDFGLSRQLDLGVTSHMTTVVAGTRGYMAPECFLGSGKATRETDVYAFGAVLLEVVSGKRPLDAASFPEYDGVLVDWVWDLLGQGRVLQAVDKRLGGEWDSEEAQRMLVVGLACSHPDPQGRPKMRRVLDALNGTAALPHVPPSKPTPTFAPSPPMSISQVMSPMGSNATTNSTSTNSSTHYSASSYDSYPFSRPPSHFVR